MDGRFSLYGNTDDPNLDDDDELYGNRHNGQLQQDGSRHGNGERLRPNGDDQLHTKPCERMYRRIYHAERKWGE